LGIYNYNFKPDFYIFKNHAIKNGWSKWQHVLKNEGAKIINLKRAGLLHKKGIVVL